MNEIESKIYNELSRDDEFAAADTLGLRVALFGTDEWSAVRESEWMESIRDSDLEGMGS